MNRKIIVALLCAALLAACAACLAETAGTKVFQLGTSAYTIVIPESFVEGERTDEDVQDDMVAYMQSPDTLLDFDVYQFNKSGYAYALADYAAAEAKDYNATEIVTDGKINDIDVAWYRAVETYESQEYTTLTYVLADGDDYVEITFWLDGDEAAQQAETIINTLAVAAK